MRKPKKYYYVAVIGENFRFTFVTKIETYPHKVAEWKPTEKPHKFLSWDNANYVALGLAFHGISAYPVVLNYELTEPIYREVENEK